MRNAGFGEGSGSILLDNLVCEGDESSLLDCASDVATGESNCQHSEDAGVRCEGMYVCTYVSVFVGAEFSHMSPTPSTYMW